MANKEFKPISIDLKKGEIYHWCQCGARNHNHFVMVLIKDTSANLYKLQ